MRMGMVASTHLGYREKAIAVYREDWVRFPVTLEILTMMNTDKRSAAAAAIASNPETYKVCDQCESIMRRTASHCVICHSYRWREELYEVVRMAQLLGSREPVLAPVTPRV
jgi:hypothetical protein